MPAEKNTLLRVVVPVVVVVAGVALVAQVYRGATRQPTTTPTTTPATTPATTPPATPSAADASTSEAPGSVADAQPPQQPPADQSTIAAAPEQAPPAAEPPAPPAPSMSAPAPGTPGALRARDFAVSPDAPPALAPLGSIDPATGYSAEVTFTLLGAGIESITLSNHFTSIDRKEHYPVQRLASIPLQDGSTLALTSLAAREIEVDGQPVNLYSGPGVRFWRETGPGAFEAQIVDDTDTPVLRLTRAYALAIDSYEITVTQRAENLTTRPLTITWRQYGPIDLPADLTGYGLDVRRMRFGHLLDPARDASRQIVEADGNLTGRSTVISNAASGITELWPDAASHKGAGPLVWLAQTSRYFAFAVYPVIDRAAAAANVADPFTNPIDKRFLLGEQAHAAVWGPSGAERVLVQLTSAPITIAPGAAADLSFAAYAGPMGARILSAATNPVFGALDLSELVVYNLGGPCAFCTFQPLARGLLWFLNILHDYVVFDWALAIMVLVVCVRSVLHPITRKAQISMTLFSRKMQALAPKQAKIRERYKDDPKRMQQEMIRLMREEKVSYAGALGCLPMFLQSPIWIALYAMLYFSFELRHQGAFFGFFQKITGGQWSFLGDLSAADHFIDFGRTIFTLPLFGHITGLNILPLLLGIVFYIQQKYLTPPPTTAPTPEQQQQQKIMRVMMVVMFPVLMYNAPSGLTIYFITNSTLGILESRWIRAHVDQLVARSGEGSDEPDEPLGRRKVPNTAPASPFKKSRALDERKRFKDR